MKDKKVSFWESTDKGNYPVDKLIIEIFWFILPVLKLIGQIFLIIDDYLQHYIYLIYFWIAKGKLVKVKLLGTWHWEIILRNSDDELISFYLGVYQFVLDRQSFLRFVLNNAPPNCKILFYFSYINISFVKSDNYYLLVYNTNYRLSKEAKKSEFTFIKKWIIANGFIYTHNKKFEGNFQYKISNFKDTKRFLVYTNSTILLENFVTNLIKDFYNYYGNTKIHMKVEEYESDYYSWIGNTFVSIVRDLDRYDF